MAGRQNGRGLLPCEEAGVGSNPQFLPPPRPEMKREQPVSLRHAGCTTSEEKTTHQSGGTKEITDEIRPTDQTPRD